MKTQNFHKNQSVLLNSLHYSLLLLKCYGTFVTIVVYFGVNTNYSAISYTGIHKYRSSHPQSFSGLILQSAQKEYLQVF